MFRKKYNETNMDLISNFEETTSMDQIELIDSNNKELIDYKKNYHDYLTEYNTLIELSRISHLEKEYLPKEQVKSNKESAMTLLNSWQKASNKGDTLASLFIIKYELEYYHLKKEEEPTRIRNLYSHEGSHPVRRSPRPLSVLKNELKSICRTQTSPFSFILLGELYVLRNKKLTGKAKLGVTLAALSGVGILFFTPDSFVSYLDYKKAFYCFTVAYLLSDSEQFKNLSMDSFKLIWESYNKHRDDSYSLRNGSAYSDITYQVVDFKKKIHANDNLMEAVAKDSKFIAFLSQTFTREIQEQILKKIQNPTQTYKHNDITSKN